MERREPLLAGETYHIFNRGAHKQPIFLDEVDYRRFQVLLYLANQVCAVDAGNILAKYQGPSLVNLFRLEERDERLVDVYAYSLMPNHFHIVLRQIGDFGVSLFMRKLCTGYSMYFNLKHDHSGTLFQGRFKSNHINSDPYFKWIFAYVHLNPVSILEPNWSKEKELENVSQAKEFLNNYRYSSYWDYYVGERSERAILAYEEATNFIDKNEDLIGLIAESKKRTQLYESFESGEK